jgi:histone-lysine N-methyltransferase SETMAR
MSARKPMATVFWDRKGVLMVEFMQQGTTVNSEVYCETLNNCIVSAIQNKRREMLTSGVVLLHDNVRPHTAARTRVLLEHFNWELFDDHPYSSDLAPSNCFRSQHFSDNEDLMEGVKTWLRSQVADFFGTGI